MRNEVGVAYVVCGDTIRGDGVDAWCVEEYSKVWIPTGAILVMYEEAFYAKLFCLDNGRRYTMCHDDFYNFTLPLE